MLDRALSHRRPGRYQLQAAIAALHVERRRRRTRTGPRSPPSTTSCARSPSPIVELNRAVAVAMADGPELGLRSSSASTCRRTTCCTPTRADLLRRLDRRERPPRPTGGPCARDERRRAGVPRAAAGGRDGLARSGSVVPCTGSACRNSTAASSSPTAASRRRSSSIEGLELARLRRVRPAEGRRGHRAAPPLLHAVRRSSPASAASASILESPTWRANPDWAAEIGLLARRARRSQPEGDRAAGGDPRGASLRVPDRDQRLRRPAGRRLQPREDADARGGAPVPLDARSRPSPTPPPTWSPRSR